MNTDRITGTRLEAWFNDHPKTTTAGVVVAILLLQVVGALLDT
jgi:hypothetical protein